MNNLYREPSQVSVHLAKRFQRRRFFRNRPIRNKNCLGQPCLLMDRDELSNHNRGLSINASHQVSVHLAKRFQRRRFFRNQPMRNKNCLWWLCLLMDRDRKSNLYRWPSIDASYQVSDHLAKRFQRRFLEINQSETRIACGSHVCKWIGTKWAPPIDASYQVSVHLAKRFQRRRIQKISQSETRVACGSHVY
jgi:hypothetical protein